MCGIFGLLDLNGKLDHSLFHLPNTLESLQHRGPDGHGFYTDSSVYLGHRRLSIIDLDTGKQPIFNEDERYCVIFNGEIYNFKEIRSDLERHRHIFSTLSDTEVIVHAYEQWGTESLQKLRGMFSFAIWDKSTRKLFLARDRLGIKPLFYAERDGVFCFASEMKSILAYDYFQREIDPDGLALYFTLGYIPAPKTIYKSINKLPPGHFIQLSTSGTSIQCYWDLAFVPDRSKNENKFIEELLSLLEEAVKFHLISDVPLGAFLSGGIDSGMLVALMSKASSKPVNTCCIGFGGNVGGYFDECETAREVAQHYGCHHKELIVHPNLDVVLEEIVRAFDEPFADPSTIPTYFLCQEARKSVTVALSGLGGDEMFAGYERYLGMRLHSLYQCLPTFLRDKIIKAIIERMPERSDGHYTVNHLKRFVRASHLNPNFPYLGFITMQSKESLFADETQFTKNQNNSNELIIRYLETDRAEDILDKVLYCDIKTYLPEDILACTDRISMRHSMEVRVPFLDHKFVEFCATIPNELKIRRLEKKSILRKAAKTQLPGAVFNHRKQGFVGPMTAWLRKDLRTQVQNILSSSNLNRHGLFNTKTVQTILEQHLQGQEIRDRLIWSLVVFQTWFALYIEKKPFQLH